MKSAVVMRSLPIDRSWKLILAAVFVCLFSFTSGINSLKDGLCPEEVCVVSLIKWFSTVQQFFEKIVKCLGPLDQSDKCCRLGKILPLNGWIGWTFYLFKATISQGIAFKD